MSRRICVIRQAGYPVELNVRREAEFLAEVGFETHVITQGSRDREDRGGQEIIHGVHVHRIPLSRKKSSLARYLYDYVAFSLAAAATVTALHLRHPFSAIQVNTMPDLLVFSTIVPKLLGAKVVAVMHEPVPELWQTLRNAEPPRILRWVEQAALAYADRVFAVTQQLKDAYVARGADASKIDILLTVPDPRFLETEGAPQATTTTDRFILICHGAIEKRYGHDTMIEAVALLRDRIPELQLRVLGSGTYRRRFLTRIGELGLESQVVYVGYVPLDQLLAELQAADVGIVAQESSPYSNLVLTNKMFEYMHFQKPVLASRLRAVQAYFGDDSIRYFEPGSAQSLADGILDLHQHPEKRQALVENSARLYEAYRWENQRQVYLSAYGEPVE